MQGNVTLYVSELFMKLLLSSAATDGPVSRKFWGSKTMCYVCIIYLLSLKVQCGTNLNSGSFTVLTPKKTKKY